MGPFKSLSRCPIALAVAATFGIGSSHAWAAAGDPLGPAFAADPATVSESDQAAPAIARNAGGETVIAWSDLLTNGIAGQRFAPDGTPLGSGFHISSPGGRSRDLVPSVAMDPEGNFVVAWLTNSYNGTPGATTISAQRFDSSGTPVGSTFGVETPEADVSEGAPGVAMDAQGDFVIGWDHVKHGGITSPSPVYLYANGQQILARRYHADGSAIDQKPIVVSSQPNLAITTFPDAYPDLLTSFTQISLINQHVAVAMDPAGDFALAWEGISSFGLYNVIIPLYLTETIEARAFDARGKARGLKASTVAATSVVSGGAGTRAARSQEPPFSPPALAMDANGDYLVSWLSVATPDSTTKLRARRFAFDGLPKLGLIDVGLASGGFQIFNAPSVAFDAAGNFVFAFLNPDLLVVAQRYSASGQPSGGLVTVSPTSVDPNGLYYSFFGNPQVAEDSSGDFAVTWSQVLPSSYPAISIPVYARLFSGS